MKMNSTQLNGYDTLDAIQKNNENTHLETEQNGNLGKNNSHKPLYLSGPSKLEYVGEWSA